MDVLTKKRKRKGKKITWMDVIFSKKRNRKGKKITLIADWSSLLQDLVISIAERQLVSLEDFVAFGAVCKSWSLAATFAAENFTGRLTRQVPFLMFPADEKDSNIRKFYSLTRCKIYQLDLMLEAKEKICYSASSGWLITTQFDPPHSSFRVLVNLVHPFNKHDQIKLPNLYSRSSSYLKFVLSSSPSSRTSSSYIVMVGLSPMTIAFCRPYDQSWREFTCWGGSACDVTYYQGRFYALGLRGSVSICDIEGTNEPGTRRIVKNMPRKLLHIPNYIKFKSDLYLVEVEGALSVVFLCYNSNDLPTSIVGFRVFKVPFTTDNWQSELEVRNLGNKALFLSPDSSFCVEASNYSGCKANCIYFLLHDRRYGVEKGIWASRSTTYMGIFHMEDGKIEFPSLVYGYRTTSLERFKWIQPC